MGAEWHTLLDDENVSIAVASAATLLVMKLRASRPGRDDEDIARLLSICDITSIEAADEIYETYYPGEVLEEKAYRILRVVFAKGLPAVPPAPTPPDLSE